VVPGPGLRQPPGGPAQAPAEGYHLTEDLTDKAIEFIKDGKLFPPLDVTRPWDSLSAEEKRLFARMAEVYAGFLAHADHHIGRLLDYLEEAHRIPDGSGPGLAGDGDASTRPGCVTTGDAATR
jgi:hypothetical protein